MTTNLVQTIHNTNLKSALFKNFNSSYRSTSLDSLANSSNSDSTSSVDSHEHDSDSGTESQSKNSIVVKCDVHECSDKDSLTSWTKTIESLKDGNSEICYEYITNDNSKVNGDKRLHLSQARIPETIPEEEPKISVKEILARFENLRDKKEAEKKEAEKKEKEEVIFLKKIVKLWCI